MKYYYCVNCGYHGEFAIYRQKNIKCESCDYDSPTELDAEEWVDDGKEKHERDVKDKFYKNNLSSE